MFELFDALVSSSREMTHDMHISLFRLTSSYVHVSASFVFAMTGMGKLMFLFF